MVGREYAKSGRLDPEFHRWLIDAQDFRNIGDYCTLLPAEDRLRYQARDDGGQGEPKGGALAE